MTQVLISKEAAGASEHREILIERLSNNSQNCQSSVKDALVAIVGCTVDQAGQALTHLPLKVIVLNEELSIATTTLQKAGSVVQVVRPKQHAFAPFFKKYREGLIHALDAIDMDSMCLLADELTAVRAAGGRIFICGNGGSASTASHMANDFGKDHFGDNRYLYKVLSLTDNVSLLTATANDCGYEELFVQQLRRLLEPGDMVIGISSSGNSENIIRALRYARGNKGKTWGLVGFDGGALKDVAEHCVYIPTKKGQYGFHEDASLIVNHMLSIFLFEQERCVRESQKT